MKQYMNVYDLNLQKTAVLQNAYNITEEQELNNIYSLSFTIPSIDPKLEFCKPFHYYRFGDTNQLYRRIKSPKHNSDVSTETIICEHVIATLCDNVLFGAHTVGGKTVKTRQVIEYVLSKQSTENWQLGECDFDFEYEYNWEEENLLNALYSIPKVFTTPYKWTFDTTRYPWVVNLKKIDISVHPNYYIRAKLNLISDETEEDYTNICTRLYPLGYGEGINQLTIKEVNDDCPYLEASPAVIARYGIKERVLVDRQFEDAETLKAYAQTVLDAMQEPAATRRFDVVDLYEITNEEIDNAQVGGICKLTEDGTITFITKTTRILDEAGNLNIELSTKPTDVASAIADLADRVRIESVYAQGATQLYQHSKDANATPSKGMVLSLYFPSEMKQINKILLRLKLNKFRSYSSTTEAGGGTITTGANTGVGEPNVTLSGQAVETTNVDWTYRAAPYTDNRAPDIWMSETGDHTHDVVANTGSVTPPASDNYRHYHAINWYGGALKNGKHKHSVTQGEHYHTIPRTNLRHVHLVNIAVTNNEGNGRTGFQHTHPISLQPHTHKIDAGIFESGNPKKFDVYINGNLVHTEESRSYNDDITMWLLGDDGLVPRNRWIDMEIRPDDNAYVVASVFIQGFVQSRGGGNY